MIQKIGQTIAKNNLAKLNKITPKSISSVVNTIENKTVNSMNNFSKFKRFFIELTDNMKSFFRRILKKEELSKSDKCKKSSIMYDEKMKKELEEQAKQRNMVKWRKEENEALIKKSGHSVSSGDIDQNGYLTSSGQKKVDNPAFKGRQDDLEHSLENHMQKDSELDTHNLHVEDKFNDLIHGKTTTNIEHDTEFSLLETIEKNHAQRNDLEQHADDLLDHSNIEDLDNLQDSLFY